MNNPIHQKRIMKSGWLRKQGGMVKTWHRRWFCLNGDCLFYFAKEDDMKPLGTIFLPGNRIVEHPYNAEEPEKILMEIFPGPGVQSKMAPNHESFLLWADSLEDRDAWVKAIRKVMHAPFGGAIFGQSIEDTMQYEETLNRKIPYFITHCVEFIRQHGMETEGIFRLAGRSAVIKDLKDKFDCAEQVTLDINEVDVNSVAALLKTYFRELPDSIIPSRFYQRFMNIALMYQDSKTEQQTKEAIEEASKAVKEIPPHSLNVLQYVCAFLYDVAAKSKINRMTNINLALVFGPNLLRNVTEVNTPELMMATADLTQQLALLLITHQKDVFKNEEEKAPVKVPEGNLLDLDVDIAPCPNTKILSPIRPGLLEDLDTIDFIDCDGNDGALFDSPTDSQSPTSPCSLERSASDSQALLVNGPIPSKRRSKMQRGRRVSERAKNDATTPPMSPSVYLGGLNLGGTGEVRKPENQVDDQVSKLMEEVKRLKENETQMAEMYNKQLNEIKSAHNEAVTKLKARLDVMKSVHDKQVASLQKAHRKELEMERNAHKETSKKLQSYQKKYGLLV